MAYAANFGHQVQANGQRMSQLWNETLRYHKNKPYVYEIRQVRQPFIYEQSFTTGKIRVLVIWDDWKDLPLEERTNIILAAVEKADGRDYRTRVALASGSRSRKVSPPGCFRIRSSPLIARQTR